MTDLLTRTFLPVTRTGVFVAHTAHNPGRKGEEMAKIKMVASLGAYVQCWLDEQKESLEAPATNACG